MHRDSSTQNPSAGEKARYEVLMAMYLGLRQSCFHDYDSHLKWDLQKTSDYLYTYLKETLIKARLVP